MSHNMKETNFSWGRFVFALILLKSAHSIYFNPIYCIQFRFTCVDISGYHEWLGIYTGLVGLYAFWLAPRSKSKYLNQTLVCPLCELARQRRKLREDRCPNCNVLMEPSKGFYDRHSELRGDKAEDQNRVLEKRGGPGLFAVFADLLRNIRTTLGEYRKPR
ncbi:MAG: hypothetical protein V3573_00560 [Desulfovibrionaceae bacterium]